MKKISVIFCVILLLALVLIPSYAQEMKKAGQAGMQFLKIETGARPAAMAGAMTMAAFDASAVFYNPAGVGRMQQEFDFSANTTQWIAEINYHSISGAYTFEGIGTFALYGIFADYGDIPGTQRAPDTDLGYIPTGNIDVVTYMAGLSYARNLATNFTIGASVKYVAQELGNSLMNDGSTKKNDVSTFAFDFGTIFYPGWHSFGFGVTVKNFSRELTYEQESFELPLTFAMGVSMNLFDLTEITGQSLLLSIDAVHPRDYTERLKFGAEYIFMDMFALRAGYKTNHDIEGLFGGLGVDVEFSGLGVRIDYAYSDIQFFDAVHRFSIGFSYN
jgi:hypothetical protein